MHTMGSFLLSEAMIAISCMLFVKAAGQRSHLSYGIPVAMVDQAQKQQRHKNGMEGTLTKSEHFTRSAVTKRVDSEQHYTIITLHRIFHSNFLSRQGDRSRVPSLAVVE